jgi:hypothetical protein
MSKWIDFEEGMSAGKTKIFKIVTKEGAQIGLIKWYSPWRKYSFFPHPNTVYETQCLSDIIAFINKLMLDRKVEKQNSQECYK